MFLTFLLASIVYYVALVVYRLYFHPLSKFPGPKLAAATRLYDFYYSVLKDGMFTWQLEKMHKKYGLSSLFRRPPWISTLLTLRP